MKVVTILVPPGGSGEHKTVIEGAKGGSCVPIMDAITKTIGGTAVRTDTCEKMEQENAGVGVAAI